MIDNLQALWKKALNKQADQTFFVNGNAITAFQVKHEGKLMWLLMHNSETVVESLLSEEEYESFRYMNQDIPFLDW